MRNLSLQLDFRQRPSSPWRWLGWSLLAAAVMATVALSKYYAEIEQGHAAAQVRAERLEHRLRAADARRMPAMIDPQTVADLKRANVIIDQLTVPWDELFDAVEAADARGLGMLSLIPNARDRTVRLAGESRSIGEVLAYVDRVAAQPALSQVHLLGYNTVQRDGISAVSFTLAANWRQLP